MLLAWPVPLAQVMRLHCEPGAHRLLPSTASRPKLYNCAPAPLQASDNPLAYGARGIGNEALPGSICTC